MAETVTIASPSFALNASEPVPKISTAIKRPARPALSAAKNVTKTVVAAGVTKRKQSKSRNGMPLNSSPSDLLWVEAGSMQ